MKQNNSGNAAYLPREEYYQDGGYLGYGGYRDAQGCRNLFFFLVIVIILAIAGGVVAFTI